MERLSKTQHRVFHSRVAGAMSSGTSLVPEPELQKSCRQTSLALQLFSSSALPDIVRLYSICVFLFICFIALLLAPLR